MSRSGTISLMVAGVLKAEKLKTDPLEDNTRSPKLPAPITSSEPNGMFVTDGTIVFTFVPQITGGSLRKVDFAKKHKKACLEISRGSLFQPEGLIQEFIKEHDIKLLNIAGTRESKEPGINEWAKGVLDRALFWSESNPNILGGPGEG